MFAGAKLKRNFENARLLVIFDILNFSGIKSNNNIVCRMSIDNNLILKDLSIRPKENIKPRDRKGVYEIYQGFRRRNYTGICKTSIFQELYMYFFT